MAPAPDTRFVRSIGAADASQLAASPPNASSPSYLRGAAAAYLISCLGYHAFLARMWHRLLALLLAPRHPHDDRLRLSRYIRIHIFPFTSCRFLLFLWPPLPLPRRRERLIQMPFISRGRSSYKWVSGLVVEYGPCP